MIAFDIRDMLKKCVQQGFSLDSISMATQLTVEELQKMLNVSDYLPENYEHVDYLGTFLMQLYYTPLDNTYFAALVDSLTTHFMISKEVIANYLNISLEELNSLENNESDIKIELLHLFTTFIMNRKESVKRIKCS